VAEQQQEKQFDPTPHRLKKAQEEGNIFRSQEMVSVAAMAVGGSVLAFGMPLAFQTMQDIMEGVFIQATATELNIFSVPAILQDVGLQVALLLAPFFGVLMVSGVALNVLQSGLHLSTKPLMPKGSRINPAEGMKRIFSKRGLFAFFKTLIKIALVAPLAYISIKNHLPSILLLHTMELQEAMTVAGGWMVTLVFQVTMAFLVLSIVDFVFEKRRYVDELKMTKQEVMDEAKEQEGDPQIKGKRRAFARELMRRPRLDHAILKADVVITNPTHYAIALRYNPEEADAPTVVAKGIRKRALRIKELAVEHKVPTVENRPLARALYGSVDEGKQIPEDLYPAVAAILAEIFRKRGRA
jgi:flagellar biosynthesis protein FlhB